MRRFASPSPPPPATSADDGDTDVPVFHPPVVAGNFADLRGGAWRTRATWSGFRNRAATAEDHEQTIATGCLPSAAYGSPTGPRVAADLWLRSDFDTVLAVCAIRSTACVRVWRPPNPPGRYASCAVSSVAIRAVRPPASRGARRRANLIGFYNRGGRLMTACPARRVDGPRFSADRAGDSLDRLRRVARETAITARFLGAAWTKAKSTTGWWCANTSL